MASTQHATQLGDNIRAHRRALGMSQEELARACYVSRPSISNWECGKTQPSAEDLALLAAAFDITADELLRDVAPASHRTSADRRELTVLFWVWLALLLVTLFAVQGWEAVGYNLLSWQFAASICSLALCLGIMVRGARIARRHGLRTTGEVVAYAQGSARPDSLSGQPAWIRWVLRHELCLGIVSGVATYFVLAAFFDGTLSLACFVLLGIPIVVIDAVSILATLRS